MFTFPAGLMGGITGSNKVASGLYTGNGSALNVTVGFQPDIVWIKPKADISPTLVDSTNGPTKYWWSSSANAFATDVAAVTSFNTDGFSVGSSTRVNTNAVVHRYFAFRSTPAFATVVAYTGTGAARTVTHNLGALPTFMITKSVAGNSLPARGYHILSGPNVGWNLNTTSYTTSIGFWNNTDPTSTVFSLGTSTDTNMSGVTYIAYLFADVPGAAGTGSYVGNGSTTGPVINLGFTPSIVGIRNSTSGSFYLYASTDPTQPYRFPLDPEETTPISFLSNGFQPASTNTRVNETGVSHYYIAWG